MQAPFIATLFGLLITIWGSFKICPMLNIEKTKCFLLDLLEFNFGALLAIVARFFFQDHVTSRQIRSLLHVWLNFINKESGSFCHQTNENKGVNIPLFVFQFSLLYKSYVNYYVHYLYLVTGRTDMDITFRAFKAGEQGYKPWIFKILDKSRIQAMNIQNFR